MTSAGLSAQPPADRSVRIHSRATPSRSRRLCHTEPCLITSAGVNDLRVVVQVTVARERLARTLSVAVPPTAAGVRLRAKPDDLHLDVEGIGAIGLPVPAEQVQELIRLGRPARFGRGEETLTDSRVRDTWEIPTSLVHVAWTDASHLDAVRDELGLPSGCALAAELHSMLVYEPGQFFVAHQDSEKDDSMIGTLVVTLPSAHTGGELVIEHGGESMTHRGSRSTISLVAFYSDCRHEVRPVKSGHRVTLTYNLLLSGDASPAVPTDEPTVGELAQCLDEHFTTPVVKPWSRDESDPPNRLVYLLDHEYTARGLSWARLKGADAGRAALLRAAADGAGGETMLALVDVQETWSAYEDEPGDYHRQWDLGDDDDEDDWDDGDTGDVELQELIESTFVLTHWTDPAGDRSEEISLHIDDHAVCATTRSVDLEPYASEYEGYMGNYGNTMDRWYRRAAIVVWPREQGFANRAEADPSWALTELRSLAQAGDQDGARAPIATLAPFWDAVVRAEAAAGFLGKALQTAVHLDDAEAAALLLRPFAVERVGPSQATALVRLATAHGDRWARQLLETWFGSRQPWWAQAGTSGRLEWLDSLPRLCEALYDQGAPGTTIAHGLLELSWKSLATTARESLKASPPSHRDERLADLAQSLAAILTTAAATGAVSTRDDIVGFCRRADDTMLVCMVPALRTAAALPAETRSDGGFDALAADCARRLRNRLSAPPRQPGDWSIRLPDDCDCELCDTLAAFLRDPTERTLEWPINKDRRQHIHSRIDTAELPVRHATRRQGRPYTLVLTKIQKLFDREKQARTRDESDLEWLTNEFTAATRPSNPI